jgi:hypothetical protein
MEGVGRGHQLSERPRMGRYRDDVLDREHPRNAGRSLQEVHEAGNGWLGCRGSGSGRGPGDRSVPTRESETCYWLVIRQFHPGRPNRTILEPGYLQSAKDPTVGSSSATDSSHVDVKTGFSDCATLARRRQCLRTTRPGSPGFQILISRWPPFTSTDDAPARSAA